MFAGPSSDVTKMEVTAQLKGLLWKRPLSTPANGRWARRCVFLAYLPSSLSQTNGGERFFVLLDGFLLYYDKEGTMAMNTLDLHPNVSGAPDFESLYSSCVYLLVSCYAGLIRGTERSFFKGVLPLRGGKCESEGDDGKFKMFSVTVRETKLMLAAEDSVVRDEWIKAIKRAQQALCVGRTPKIIFDRCSSSFNRFSPSVLTTIVCSLVCFDLHSHHCSL